MKTEMVYNAGLDVISPQDCPVTGHLDQRHVVVFLSSRANAESLP
jgi:hypothetical protein